MRPALLRRRAATAAVAVAVFALVSTLGPQPVPARGGTVHGPTAGGSTVRGTTVGPYRVLVFTKTAGYRHASIPDGVTAIRRLGVEHGFTVDTTADSARFTDAGLRPYATVVWLSTTGNLLTASEQGAFERYIRHGGGYLGIHAAADAEYGWTWYGGLVGAVFRAHPPVQRDTVLVTDRHNPATALLPARWTREDEWYDFRSGPSPRLHLLASDGPTTYPDGHRGGGHPVVWCQDYDGGRSFYIAFGHTTAGWREPAFLDLLLGGIRSTAGWIYSSCFG